MKTSVAVGIISYDDIRNVGPLVKYFENIFPGSFLVEEVFVVTTHEVPEMEDLAKELEDTCPKSRFLFQHSRRGKAAAINEFLAAASADILVLCSGDVYPAADTLQKMLAPFQDSRVGMSGGKVMPIYDKNRFVQRMDAALWDMHHLVASVCPKLGEMVAFRSQLVSGILSSTAVDEAYIESCVTGAGYCLRYVKDAVIYNYADNNLGDYVRKRIRISAGHCSLRKQYGYKVSTDHFCRAFQAWWKNMRLGSLKDVICLLAAAMIEVVARVVGVILYSCRQEPAIWALASNKRPISVPELLDGK